MDWISSNSFVVLINGALNSYFGCSRGPHQGFPLSLLMFILVIEGLSRIIRKMKDNKLIKGIKISHTLYITHLIFVNDVLLLGMGNIS